MPTLGLLVTLYTGALSLVRPNMLDFLSSFLSYYIIILCLNLSIASILLRLASRSLNSYFLVRVLISLMVLIRLLESWFYRILNFNSTIFLSRILAII